MPQNRLSPQPFRADAQIAQPPALSTEDQCNLCGSPEKRRCNHPDIFPTVVDDKPYTLPELLQLIGNRYELRLLQEEVRAGHLVAYGPGRNCEVLGIDFKSYFWSTRKYATNQIAVNTNRSDLPQMTNRGRTLVASGGLKMTPKDTSTLEMVDRITSAGRKKTK
jgi:hypothetical protein